VEKKKPAGAWASFLSVGWCNKGSQSRKTHASAFFVAEFSDCRIFRGHQKAKCGTRSKDALNSIAMLTIIVIEEAALAVVHQLSADLIFPG
jgi:hypothetical protein